MSTQAGKAAGDASGDVFLDADTLSRLRTGTDPAAVAAAWLGAMARLNPALAQGVVVLAATGKSRMRPAAVWPEGAQPVPELLQAVEGSVRSERLIVATRGSDGAAVAAPLVIEGRVRGAVGFLAEGNADADLRLVIDQLQWGSGWLEALIRRRQAGAGNDLATVLELLATSLHHSRFREAAMAVATELAAALGCELVAIGMPRRRHMRVRALSNSANFGKRANLVRAIEAAMDEAADQQSVVVYPPEGGAPERVVRAHQALSEREGMAAICTVPLTEDGRITGALLLERDKDAPFDAETVRHAEHVAVLVGPVLDVKRREDRWLATKALDSAGGFLGALFGRRHAALKLAVLAVLAVAAFFWFATGTYRVTADAVVEGEIKRAVTAPLAGYLAESGARAGDVVAAGEVMARLDDRDLRLERLKWQSQKARQSREYSEAVAQRERAQARILQAQIEAADAQLALLDQQIARMTIAAPFDGIVVSGDLTQALGAPLERGDVLFEVAPLDRYRVTLSVDERDVRDVAPGQDGALVLSSLTDTPYRVEVERVTPISTAEEGTNVFLVRAAVTDGPLEDLRPGMEGVAKIEIDERRLAWIWTRPIVLWARMTLWSWWP